MNNFNNKHDDEVLWFLKIYFWMGILIFKTYNLHSWWFLGEFGMGNPWSHCSPIYTCNRWKMHITKCKYYYIKYVFQEISVIENCFAEIKMIRQKQKDSDHIFTTMLCWWHKNWILTAKYVLHVWYTWYVILGIQGIHVALTNKSLTDRSMDNEQSNC